MTAASWAALSATWPGEDTGHLIDADAGQPTSNGTGIDLLDVPTPASNVLNVTGVDVGPNGPHLLDLGVLTGTNGLNIPSLNGAGTDSLTGNILSGGTASAPAAGTAPTPPSPTLRTSTAYCRDRSRATTASSGCGRASHHLADDGIEARAMPAPPISPSLLDLGIPG